MIASIFDADQGAGRSAYQPVRAMPRNAERREEGCNLFRRRTLGQPAALELSADASASPLRAALHSGLICAVIAQGISDALH